MSFRTQAAALLSWWLHELRELADTVLGRVAPKLVRFVVIREGEPFDVQSAEGVSRAVGVLAPHDVLIYEFTLPLAVERELDRAVGLHLERDLPMPLDRVYADWRVAHRDRAARSVRIRVFVAHRQPVDRLRDQIVGLGLCPIRIAATDPDGTAVGNLLPSRARTDRLRLTAIDRRLAAFACALGLSALAATAGQWCYERYRLGDEIKKTTSLERQVESLARTLREGSAGASALIAEISRPDAVDVLTTLTSAAPQDTWAYELDVKPGQGGAYEVRVSGFAPAATVFVGTVENVAGFDQVRLVSASSAGLGTGKDRFQLNARFVRP